MDRSGAGYPVVATCCCVYIQVLHSWTFGWVDVALFVGPLDIAVVSQFVHN